MIAHITKRSFSSTLKSTLKDSSKAAATLVDLRSSNITTNYSNNIGNSWKSFAEYRKSAIQHGPLKKNLLLKNNDIEPILTENKDYGVSQSFAEKARSINYRV
ncbi:hypothetical protein BN7_3105 [Wickerhamomyces ciferrii]|uniref:Uncharacterized protein n=1 Tax=Wickerhamomyces ciferrii (strain ATCC 14091 / BCRC 22168 / CBS 111 / JCM 3599 / NBRC 0793 / NRRL Y-1031 F-60-10) TaxID=1206466 RepID=K0KQL5_WICCF|nr:uncharacterized protein BN7_3105 [Wickerhamomyces ciferrii]CCH43553.1 hypothetical protein BN7_3105 [Wickerhamomyces ciferrii]